MHRIGEFAKISGISIETLRHYDQLGILTPAQVDPQSGYRLYEAAQLTAVYEILALKDAGLSLSEIAEVREALPDAQALVSLLEAKATLMRHALHAQGHRLERLLTRIFLVKNGGVPQMHTVTIKSTLPIWVCSQRRQIKKQQFDEALEAMWPAVNAHIDQAHGKRVIPCLMLYHDNTYDFQQPLLDIEVAEPLAEPIEAGEGVEVYALPAVEQMACTVHEGPFQTIGKAYALLETWLREGGYLMDGPLREIYHKGDWATDDPNAYITELQVPVRKA